MACGSGPDGGLSSYVDGSFQHIAAPKGQDNIRVRAIVEDHAHAVWVGTQGAGAYRMDQHGTTVFDNSQGLAGNSVIAMLEDRQGRIWVGSNQGLDLIDQGIVSSQQSLLPGSNRSAVHLIYEDFRGSSGSALKHAACSSSVLTEPSILAQRMACPAITSLPFTKMSAAPSGSAQRTDWLCGAAGRSSSLAQFGGLMRETILQILEDKSHRFWMTTNRD